MSRKATYSAGGVFLNIFAVLVLLFLVAPILIVIPMSFSDTRFLTFPPQGFTLEWYEEVLTSRSWTRPLAFSVQTALLTALCSTTLGVIAAYALARGNIMGRGAIRLAILAPIITPNIVLAISIYFSFVKLGLIGSITGFVIAHSVLCIPFVVLITSASLSRQNPRLELAAQSLGASRFTAFVTVTLPGIRAAVLGGFLFSFIISFDEAVISYFISGIRQATLPRVMFQYMETSVEPNIAAISTLLVLASAVLIFIGRRLIRN